MSQSTEEPSWSTLPHVPEDGNWAEWLNQLTTEQLGNLRQVMLFDPASGLMSSAHFLDLFKAEVERSKRYKRILAVAVIRLDCFENILTDRGTDSANSLLKEAAGSLRRSTRAVDLAGRVTKNELVVLMPETDGSSGAMVASRICHHIVTTIRQSPDFPNIDEEDINLSVGVAAFPRDAKDWSELLFWARTDLERHPC